MLISSVSAISNSNTNRPKAPTWWSACVSTNNEKLISHSYKYQQENNNKNRVVLPNIQKYTLNLNIVSGYQAECLAYGYMQDEVYTTGW